MTTAEAFLLDQMPLAMRALIPTTLKTAYAAAEAHIGATPFLNVPSATDNRGRIIQWAVDFGFQGLIESGQWQADFRWRPFASPTGRFLEIVLPHSAMTISQVKTPRKQSRDVVFRHNKRLNNQGHLDFPGFAEDSEISGLPHILLLHGHQTLNFSHLAIPNERHSLGWIHRTSNLMLMPHLAAAPEEPPPPVENTDYEAVMTLKERVDAWKRDNGHD